jgi:cell wall-associated NlpC family hydrolase
MSRNRTTAAMLFFAASIPALAAAPLKPTPSCSDVAREALYSLGMPAAADAFFDAAVRSSLPDSATVDEAVAPTVDNRDARELLAAFAMTLRDIRYRRGGHAPKTGFDCSGFVQYVFAHALGIDLPGNSTGQFHFGATVPRSELRTGDLVFFHTRGKRVSHVGIYLDGGRFIHSPSTGKRVRVDDLDERYWARRYVGARRPDTLS